MNQSMLNNSFSSQLKKLDQILAKSAKESNKAEFLFNSNARTPFFMLESIFRILRKIDAKNNTEFWYEEFKYLEDALGKIDYYHFFAKELQTKKTISEKTIYYFVENQNKSFAELNTHLNQKKWFTKTGLENLNKDVIAICNSVTEKQILSEILKEIEKINAFVKSEIKYTDVELSTHEIRRKLRWISIYCQAFQGLFQMRHHSKSRIKLEKYLTTEIITSPFNKFPAPAKTQQSVFLKDNYFFALSWIINELGNLKDKGLFVLALTEAIENTEKTSHTVSFAKACKILGENKNCITTILKQTEVLVTEFFEKDVLNKLAKDIKRFNKQ
ncbi:MAG: hypothetical protein V4667_00950 [Bacteroidota bacterium]